MRTSADQPRKGTPGIDTADDSAAVRALVDRWKAEAARYRQYAIGSSNPGMHRSVAKTLAGVAEELSGALAQDHRARLLRETEAEWVAAHHRDKPDPDDGSSF